MDAPLDQARGVAGRQHGLITHRQLARLGFTDGRIRNLLRDSSRAVLPGVYLLDAKLHPATWAELPLQTRVRAAILFHGVRATICLNTAARLWGVGGLPPDDASVHVLLPPGTERHQVDGVVVHTRLLDPNDVHYLGDVRVTSPFRTVVDLVLAAAADDMRATLVSRRNQAVRILDSVLHKRLVGAYEVLEMARSCRGRRGAAIARDWWPLADGRAASPLESDVRMIATDAELPPDDLQVPVLDDHGVLLGNGDLGWRLSGGRWLIAEADGVEPHENPKALFRDRFRANDFAATGRIVMIRFTWADVRRPAYVVSQLRRHLNADRAAS